VRHTPEQVINKLRQAEVELSRGATVGAVCRKLGITDDTSYRWRTGHGETRAGQAKRLKALSRGTHGS
jgi:transposase-like protein